MPAGSSTRASTSSTATGRGPAPRRGRERHSSTRSGVVRVRPLSPRPHRGCGDETKARQRIRVRDLRGSIGPVSSPACTERRWRHKSVEMAAHRAAPAPRPGGRDRLAILTVRPASAPVDGGGRLWLFAGERVSMTVTKGQPRRRAPTRLPRERARARGPARSRPRPPSPAAARTRVDAATRREGRGPADRPGRAGAIAWLL